jgi:hypothetical protein
MRKLSIAAAAVLVLAACGGQRDEDAGNGGDAAEAPSEAGGADGGAAAIAITPGEWELTVEMIRMSAPGMPAGATPPTMPPTTIRTCLTPEQAGRPTPGFLTGGGADNDCTYENLSTAGGRLQGTVQCTTPDGNMRTTFDGRITAESYEMTQQAQISTAGAPGMEMESRVTGRRIGDCPGG